MVDALSFHYLGAFEVHRSGVSVALDLQDKTLAMIAYLAYRKQPQLRQSLAHLFCSEAKNQAASLRWHISRIRKAFGPDFLQSHEASLTIEWEREACDATHFTAALDGELTQLSDADLDAALDLYRGEFLQGYQIKHAPNFDIWLAGERSRFGLLFEKGMQARIQRFLAAYAHDEAMAYAQRLLELDPLREELHSLLMWLYAKQGQREAATQQYTLCKQIRASQLDVPLLEETELLHQQIVEGDFAPAYEAWLQASYQGELVSLTPPEELTSLVGREQELGALRAKWRGALQGEGCSFLLEGEAGAGKTTLAERFARHCAVSEGALTLHAHAYDATQHIPYHPWLEILEPLCDGLSTAQIEAMPPFVLTQLARLLPHVVSQWPQPVEPHKQPPEQAQDELHQLHAALRYLLNIAQARLPLLLWFDDLHWLDDASAQLLLVLARGLSSQRSMFLLSYRPENIADSPHVARILDELKRFPSSVCHSVSALVQADLEALISLALPEHQPVAALASQLHQHTGGNAFFVHELLQAMASEQVGEGGAVSSLDLPESASFRLPASVRQSLEQTLATLSDAQAQVIEVLAVFAGPTTWVALSHACHQGEAALMAAVEWGLARRFLESVKVAQRESICFRHAIVQQAIVESLSPIRRQLLHKRVAEALVQTGATAAALVFHWHGAGMAVEEAEAAERAAQDALACYAYDEAIHYLQRSIALTATPEHKLDLERNLGELLQLVGRWEQAEDAFQAALGASRALRLPHQIAKSALLLGQCMLARGQLERAGRWLGQARDAFGKLEDHEGAYLAWRHLATVHRRRGELDLALVAHEAQAALATSMQHDAYRTEAYSAMSGLFARMGRPEEALACFETTLQIATEEPDLLAPLADEASDAHEALVRKDGLLTISKLMDRGSLLAEAQDSYMEALAKFEEQLRFHGDSGEMGLVHKGWEQLSTWYALLGDANNAMRFVQRLFALAAQEFSFPGLRNAAGNLGVLYQRAGAYPQAQACFAYKLSIAMDLRETRGIANALRHLAEIRWRQHDHTQASTCATLAVQLCHNGGFLVELLPCLLLQAAFTFQEGDQESAATIWEEAHKLALRVAMEDALLPLPALASKWSPDGADDADRADVPALPMQIQQFHHTLAQQVQRIEAGFVVSE